MKFLARFAAALYPRWWRSRYGPEFVALLDDSPASGRVAWDTFKGALAMQLKTWTPMRAFLSATLAGLACSAIMFALPPVQVTSVATIRVPGLEHESKAAEQAERMRFAQQRALSDETLRAAALTFQLYPGRPESEMVEAMRRDLRVVQIKIGPTSAIQISYPAPLDLFMDARRFDATRVTAWASTELIDADAVSHAKELRFQILDSASLPVSLEFLRRRDALVLSPVIGFFTGLLLAAMTWWRKRGRGATAALVQPPAMSGI